MVSCFIMLCLISLCVYGSDYDDGVAELRGDPALITYVKSSYERTMHGINYLLYPAQNPQQLWILFNGATPGKYTMWSWFWREDEAWDTTAYLFLKDDDIRWYLGSAEEAKTTAYLDIITHVMDELGLEPSQICTIGHSMGGYAALYYGLQLAVGSIYVFRPQVTWDAAVTYYSIKKLHDVWVDIDKLVRAELTLPSIYIQYGEFMPDKLGGKALVDAYIEQQGTIIVE